jgi:arylsulfatase
MGNRQLLFGRMGRLTEGSIININIKNKSHAVTADLVVPDSGAEGVIVAGGNDREAGAFTPKTASENIVTSSTVWSVTT